MLLRMLLAIWLPKLCPKIYCFPPSKAEKYATYYLLCAKTEHSLGYEVFGENTDPNSKDKPLLNVKTTTAQPLKSFF